MAQTDRKLRREYIEFGNYILVEHDKLPAWGGVIETPRRWTGAGEVVVSAKSAEHLFTYRFGDDLKLNGTAGSIFHKIVDLTNKDEDLYIREGEIYAGGIQREETLQSGNLLDDIKGLAERSANDFALEPRFTSSRTLYFEANWYYQKGVYRPDVPLMEGHNIELPEGSDFLTEQGDIQNWVQGYGDGATAAARIKKNAFDRDSIASYRMRKVNEYFSGNTQAGTIEDNARKTLAQRKQPERVFRLYALDVGRTWSIRLGDIVPLEVYSVGFNQLGGYGLSTTIRVTGMSYQEDDSRLELIGKEVTA